MGKVTHCNADEMSALALRSTWTFHKEEQPHACVAWTCGACRDDAGLSGAGTKLWYRKLRRLARRRPSLDLVSNGAPRRNAGARPPGRPPRRGGRLRLSRLQ